MEREITSQAEQGAPAAADHVARGAAGEEEPDAAGELVAVAEQHETRTESGDLRVDHALRGLDNLADLPVSEHPAVFERIHGQLVEVLGELRSGPGKGGYGRQAD